MFAGAAVVAAGHARADTSAMVGAGPGATGEGVPVWDFAVPLDVPQPTKNPQSASSPRRVNTDDRLSTSLLALVAGIGPA